MQHTTLSTTSDGIIFTPPSREIPRRSVGTPPPPNPLGMSSEELPPVSDLKSRTGQRLNQSCSDVDVLRQRILPNQPVCSLLPNELRWAYFGVLTEEKARESVKTQAHGICIFYSQPGNLKQIFVAWKSRTKDQEGVIGFRLEDEIPALLKRLEEGFTLASNQALIDARVAAQEESAYRESLNRSDARKRLMTAEIGEYLLRDSASEVTGMCICGKTPEAVVEYLALPLPNRTWAVKKDGDWMIVQNLSAASIQRIDPRLRSALALEVIKVKSRLGATISGDEIVSIDELRRQRRQRLQQSTSSVQERKLLTSSTLEGSAALKRAQSLPKDAFAETQAPFLYQLPEKCRYAFYGAKSVRDAAGLLGVADKGMFVCHVNSETRSLCVTFYDDNGIEHHFFELPKQLEDLNEHVKAFEPKANPVLLGCLQIAKELPGYVGRVSQEEVKNYLHLTQSKQPYLIRESLSQPLGIVIEGLDSDSKQISYLAFPQPTGHWAVLSPDGRWGVVADAAKLHRVSATFVDPISFHVK